MSGSKPGHPIALTSEEQEHLHRLVRAHTTGQRLEVRQWRNQPIVQAAQTSDRLVRKRRQWLAACQRYKGFHAERIRP
jgi:hypothetical protein